MILVDNPLIPLLFSALAIAGMGWLIQRVVNTNREIDKQIDKSLDEIKNKDFSIIHHNSDYMEAIDRINREFMERYRNSSMISPSQLENIRRNMPSQKQKIQRLESKDLTPLSEQLEKLKK